MLELYITYFCLDMICYKLCNVESEVFLWRVGHPFHWLLINFYSIFATSVEALITNQFKNWFFFMLTEDRWGDKTEGVWGDEEEGEDVGGGAEEETAAAREAIRDLQGDSSH